MYKVTRSRIDELGSEYIGTVDWSNVSTEPGDTQIFTLEDGGVALDYSTENPHRGNALVMSLDEARQLARKHAELAELLAYAAGRADQ